QLGGELHERGQDAHESHGRLDRWRRQAGEVGEDVEELLHGDVLARQDVALAAPSLFHRGKRAARDVFDINDAEPAIEVERRAPIEKVRDLLDRLRELRESGAEDQSGVRRAEGQSRATGDREGLLLGGDLTAHVMRVWML